MSVFTRRRAATAVTAAGTVGAAALTAAALAAASLAAAPAALAARAATLAAAPAALAAAPAALAAAPAALAARAATPRAAIDGTRPGWAVTGNRVTAQPMAAGSLAARVYLAGRDPAGLASYAAAVSAPGSPSYRQFLSPAQASARFGVTGAEITAVRSWLTGAGLRVTQVSDTGPAGAYVAVRGSLAAAGRAFAVRFGRFRGPGGQVYRAPDQQASAPAAVAGSVLAITGLDTAPHVATPDLTATPDLAATSAGQTPAAPGAGRATAAGSAGTKCSRYFGQNIPRWVPRAYGRHWPTALCGYIPRQLRTAYGVTSSGMTGRGQSVAIVDAYDSPTIVRDAARYARLTGDPVFRPGQFRRYQAGPFLHRTLKCGPPPIWNLEQTLDVESSHGVATDAAIRYVAARSCRQQDMLDALAVVVNHHLASIVSDSWGWGESDWMLHAAANAVFQLGAVEGIGFFFSTGDHGYVEGGKVQVEYPASSPYVTAVGATSLAAGPSGQYRWETSWGTVPDPLVRTKRGVAWKYPPPGPSLLGAARYGGGGGGVSTRYPQPFYQRGIVPLRLATTLPGGHRSKQPMRVLPDVAADGNSDTGFRLGIGTLKGGRYTFHTFPVGGTSQACPTVAAIEASAQQAAGGPLGFADPAIYARYRTAAFHDVTDHPLGLAHPSVIQQLSLGTALDALNIDGSGPLALPAVRGYDDATGVGTPARYIQSFRP